MDVGKGQKLGKPFGDDDHSVVATEFFTGEHHGNHFGQHGLHVHDLAGLARSVGILDCLARSQRSDDVFDAQDQACIAGDRGPVGEPSGRASHRLGDEIRLSGRRIAIEISDLVGQDFCGAEVTEGKIDAGVIVVDGLGQMDHRHTSFARWQCLLVEFHLVGGLERVIATDAYQGIDPKGPQGAIASAQGCGLLGILKVRRAFDDLARIGSCRPDANPWLGPHELKRFLGESQVMLPFDQRFRGIEIDEIGVPVLDSNDLDACLQEAEGCRGDHGVGCRCRSARKQNRDALDVAHGNQK